MIIEEKNNSILISFENQIEKELLKKIIEDNKHSTFVLNTYERGILFTRFSEKNFVDNSPLNVLYSSQNQNVKLISNLAHTPFMLNNIKYESLEGFWQSLKFSKEEEKIEVTKLFGKEAKKMGSRQKYHKNVYFENKRFRTGSPEHWSLMEKACRAKFFQNVEAQQALLSTVNRHLCHRPSKDSRTIPGAIMAEIWMKIRAELID